MDKKAKGLFKEFKEFISRGNVIDLAVGIIIGNAFTAIVNSMVQEMIMPLIAWITGGINFEDRKLVLVQAANEADGLAILYGSFINQIINFIIIAFVVFIMVKLMNTFRRKKEAQPEPAAPPAVPEDIRLLSEIRDLLQERAKSE